MKFSLKIMMNTAKLATVATFGFMLAPQEAAAQEFYIGQIIPTPYTFCQRGTIATNGQLLPIAQNTAMFSLLGTTYGGDGRTTFGVPDLRGRVPIHNGNGPGLTSRPLGQKGGVEQVTMTQATMPAHSHRVGAVNAEGDKGSPASDLLAKSNIAGQKLYHDGPADVAMDGTSIQNAGGNLPIHIMNPYITLQYCIATVGIFPSRS